MRLCAATDNRRRMRSADTRDNAEQVLKVSDGSIATEIDCPRDVRFPPSSDQTADMAGGPFGAKLGSRQHR